MVLRGLQGNELKDKQWVRTVAMNDGTGGWTRRHFVETASPRAVASTGQYAHWVCAPVNLEKAFLHS